MVARACMALILIAAGCGDGIDCPEDLGLELVSPAGDGPISLADDRSGRPGVQVDVVLRSVLQAGEPAELVVSGADGGQEQHAAIANDDGELTFPLVTLPTGDVALVVTADSQRCGHDEAALALSVLGPACALELAEEVIASDFYDSDLLNGSADADPAAPGFQAHVEVASEDGFEVEVFVAAGDSETSSGVTTAEGALASLPVTLGQGRYALRAECRAAEGTESAATLPHSYFVDTLPPVCALESPVDGAIIDPAVDEQPDAGVQVTLRGRVLGDDVSGEPTTFTAGGQSDAGTPVADDGSATILWSFEQSGGAEVEFSARDHAENPCTDGVAISVNLAALAVAFDQPVASGVVGPGSGAVVPGGLELLLCGTVSEPADSVVITVDGGAPIQAELDGAAFCAPAPVTLAESPPSHPVSALAVVDDRQATSEVDLVVDLTAPAAPGALAVTGVDRQALEIAFVAPDDGVSGVASYQLKIADRSFTAGNFDSIGAVLPAPAPGPPGTPQSLLVESLRAGSRYHVGAVAIDRAGNRSPVATAGPTVLRLDATGAIRVGDPNGRLGAALAAGLLDGDGDSDLAIGAPLDDGPATDSGRVRVFTGGADGIGLPPARTLAGSTSGARFGASLAVLDWNDDGQADLAVGAPGAAGGSGRVFIHLGPLGPGPADAVISVAASSALLAGGEIGSSLAAADFDGDGADDLLLGAPGAAGGDGAALVLFGGPSGAIALDEADPDGPAGYLMAEPGAITGGRFGEHVFGLGPTESPLDPDDDLGVAYRDEYVAFLLRGRARPAAGLAPLAFDPSVDLRLENPSTDPTTGFGAQMASLSDQDGDGIRDLAVGAWLQAGGRVYLVRGGLSGLRTTSGPAVRSTIVAAAGVTHLGAAIADGGATGVADIDMDGREDLVLVGDAGRLRLYVFFGGSIPTGRVRADLAPYQVNAPPAFLGAPATSLRPALVWAGDTSGDGLDDLAWADPSAAAFEVLWDER